MSSLRWVGGLCFLGLFAGALVIACGGSDDDSTSTRGALAPAAPVAEGDFYPRFVAAVCDGIAPCCTNDGDPFTQGTCASLLNGGDAGTGVDVGSVIGAFLGQHGVGYDPQAAGDCLEGIKQYESQCAGAPVKELDAVLQTYASPKLFACYHVYTGGTKKPGETCTQSFECAIPAGGAGGCIFADDKHDRMVCATYVRAKLGEACTPLGDDTVHDGHWCELDAILNGDTDLTKLNRCDPGTKKCVPYAFAAVGKPCADEGPFCVLDAYCPSDRHTCVARADVGAPCAGKGECKDGLNCGPAQTCVAATAVGGACQNDDDCTTDHCNSAKVCASDIRGFASTTLCGHP